jgi:hypothetical protein
VKNGVLQEPSVAARCTSIFPADADWK